MYHSKRRENMHGACLKESQCNPISCGIGEQLGHVYWKTEVFAFPGGNFVSRGIKWLSRNFFVELEIFSRLTLLCTWPSHASMHLTHEYLSGKASDRQPLGLIHFGERSKNFFFKLKQLGELTLPCTSHTLPRKHAPDPRIFVQHCVRQTASRSTSIPMCGCICSFLLLFFPAVLYLASLYVCISICICVSVFFYS